MEEKDFELILQPDAKGIDKFMKAVEACISIKGCVAFWTININDDKYKPLIQKLKSEKSFVCIDFHKPTNIDYLVKWQEQTNHIYLYTSQFRSQKQASEDTITSNYLMHSKVFVFEFEEYSEVWIGSHNMTKRAMEGGNIEASIILKLDNNDAKLKEVLDYLEKIKKECELFDVIKNDTYKYFQHGLNYESDFVIECFYDGDLGKLKEGSTITYLGENIKEFEEYKLINRRLKLYIFNKTEAALYEIKIINAGAIEKNNRESYDMTFSERLVAVKKSRLIAVFTEPKQINKDEFLKYAFYMTFDIKRRIQNVPIYNILKSDVVEWIEVNSDVKKINPEFKISLQEVKLQEELQHFLDNILKEYGFIETVIDYQTSFYKLDMDYLSDDHNKKKVLPFTRVKIFSKIYFIEIKNDSQDLFTT